MLKIEFISEENNDNIYTSRNVIVNGITDYSSSYGSEKYSFFANDEVKDILINHSFNDLSETFSFVSMFKKVEWWEDPLELGIPCNVKELNYYPYVKIYLKIKWQNWAKAWSILRFSDEMQTALIDLKNDKIKYFEDNDGFDHIFGIEYFIFDTDSLIISIIDDAFTILSKLVEETNERLISTIDKDTILTYFQFPEEIKTACKQYLIYFTQFIADIGISVDTEIKEEAKKTLFKIIPRDKTQGLKLIQEALEIYINAPSSMEFQIQIANYNDVSIRQWEANIYHLKSQLALANSILQSHQATIESLQLSNYQYRQLLELKNNKPKNDNEEDIIKGIVSLKKYDGKGFSIDFAELFRRLKRSFI